jgi:hypothetical protein
MLNLFVRINHSSAYFCAIIIDYSLKWVYSVLQHELEVTSSDFTKSAAESAHKKISKIFNASIFCLEELGVWFALKVLSLLLLRLYLWRDFMFMFTKLTSTVFYLIGCGVGIFH